MSLMTCDLERAQAFYGGLLGWRFKPSRHGEGRYSIALVDGSPTVGLSEPPSPAANMPASWTTYFAADDANEVARRAQEHGGTIAVGPIDFGGGRVAWAADPGGAAFGIWEGELTTGWWAQRRIGAPLWLELRTRDAFDAALFYGDVFRWDAQPTNRFDVRYEHDRVILRIDGHSAAGLSSGAAEDAPDASIRPRWHVYFGVTDVDATAERASALGAKIIAPPEDSPFGRIAALRDPQGALFSIAISAGDNPGGVATGFEGSGDAGAAGESGSSGDVGGAGSAGSAGGANGSSGAVGFGDAGGVG
jgi:uncharacterized protein